MMKFISPAKLTELGILGMNRRNISFIGQYNPRRNYRLVDDKLLTKKAAIDNDIPVPQLYGIVERQQQINGLAAMLAGYDGFAIKPSQGSGGKGILVITGRKEDCFVKSSGVEISTEEIGRHITNTLAGLHSLGGRNDRAMIEALISFDPCLEGYSYEGIPDIRVIAFKGIPVMAMMRCATHSSDGKANLHQGAVGVGLNIATGRSVGAVQHGQLVEVHPDTGAIFSELQVPHGDNILDLAARCVEMTGLGYLGVDIVLDRNFGPMLLELNARPGLAIQVANQSGLRHRLAIALKIAEQTDDHDTKIALAKEHFGGQ